MYLAWKGILEKSKKYALYLFGLKRLVRKEWF
jgi:hypothetical protein